MNILIIEDERPNADRLERLTLTIRPDANIVGIIESVADSVEYLTHNPVPDLILMDVKLSDGLSFDIFEKINIDSPIIFTTAYDEFAVNAFKRNSVDYLLKPVEREELSKAFEKLNYFTNVVNTSSIQKLLNEYKPKQYRNRFLIPYKDGFKAILISDVYYFCTIAKVTNARLIDGSEIMLPQPLDELEHQLDPQKFFRVNRQYIIHIDSIDEIRNYFNSKLKVILKKYPDIEIIVSREKAPFLKSWLGY